MSELSGKDTLPQGKGRGAYQAAYLTDQEVPGGSEILLPREAGTVVGNEVSVRLSTSASILGLLVGLRGARPIALRLLRAATAAELDCCDGSHIFTRRYNIFYLALPKKCLMT